MIRIQRSRGKGWKMPEGAVSVCRPGKWGNPFVVGCDIDTLPFLLVKHLQLSEEEIEDGVITRKIARDAFEYYLLNMYHGKILMESISELKGKIVCCWCPPGEPCHGDILLKLANK